MALLAVILTRYYALQVTEYEAYRTQSDRNRVQLQPLPPKRGLIYDRNGVLLADNTPSFILSIVRERVSDLDATLTALQDLLPISEGDLENFQKKLQRRRPYEAVPLRFRLTEDERARLAVNRYRLPGVVVDAQLLRHYPHGALFSHALGYVGRINEREVFELDESDYRGTFHVGKVGVEKYYEDILHGEVGYQNVESNAHGRVLRVLERHAPVPGVDLTLHLDIRIQRAAVEALGDRRGAVVAIDPLTGGVLALVSTPGFDTNLFVNGISSKDYSALRDSLDVPLFNRAIQGQYPPGSTVKPFMGLAGLETGISSSHSKTYCPGFYRLPGKDRKYRDWKRTGHGTVDLNIAITQSCDVYFYDLAQSLGIDRIHDYLQHFGFGKATGIDIQGELSGLLPSKEWKRNHRDLPWFPGETIITGIGQGFFLVTPIQLATATAALANGGHMLQPNIVHADQEAESDDLVPHQTQLLETITIKEQQHWDQVLAAMTDVVHSARGTARRIGMDSPYRIAGKTGTAQVFGLKEEEKYDASAIAEKLRDHALFIAFAPVDNPRIVVAVIVENGGGGGSVAAPIARKILDAYLEVPPS